LPSRWNRRGKAERRPLDLFNDERPNDRGDQVTKEQAVVDQWVIRASFVIRHWDIRHSFVIRH
jgi:hypothetical protein